MPYKDKDKRKAHDAAYYQQHRDRILAQKKKYGQANKAKIRVQKREWRAQHPEYIVWKSMKQRCYYTKAINYVTYGKKGIKMCDRWKDSYQNFFSDMGRKPSPDYVLHRLGEDVDYAPGMCKWVHKDWHQKMHSMYLAYKNRMEVL